jgi:hypothetical protein
MNNEERERLDALEKAEAAPMVMMFLSEFRQLLSYSGETKPRS